VAANLGIKILTVYAFSTENWSRSAEEVESLMKLFEMYLRSQKDHMVASGVKLDVIGDIDKLPRLLGRLCVMSEQQQLVVLE